jgi:hypothetical protein
MKKIEDDVLQENSYFTPRESRWIQQEISIGAMILTRPKNISVEFLTNWILMG